MLGISTSSASTMLETLRSEADLQTGFIGLSDNEYDSLRESIRQHGVRVPIVIGEHVRLVDGRHRFSAAVEVGLDEVPAIFLHGFTEEEELDLTVELNVARRHLSEAQRRAVIRSELKRNWARSDRSIALLCGSTHPTVAAVRDALKAERGLLEKEHTDEELTEAAETLTLPHEQPKKTEKKLEDFSSYEDNGRLGRDGKVRKPPERTPKIEPEMTYLGRGVCTHGQMLRVLRHRDGHLVMEVDLD